MRDEGNDKKGKDDIVHSIAGDYRSVAGTVDF